MRLPGRKPPADRSADVGMEPELLGHVSLLGARSSWGAQTWHSDGVNRYPLDEERFVTDLPGVLRESVFAGHGPETGTLTVDDTVVTVGSCFARHVRKYLAYSGASAKGFHVPEGLNNTFAILDFVSWCITGRDDGRAFRYDRLETGEIREWTPEVERREYLDAISAAGAFVFTLGLAEVWEDRETGGVFWRGVPAEIFDADRHVFRLSSVEENEANLLQVVELVRSVTPSAPIVFTLSPVALKATFREGSCVTADCVSKSTLRVAVDRVLARGIGGVYYWPAFEVFRWIGPSLPYSVFGRPDSRHANMDVVAEVLEAFIDRFWTREAAEALRARADTARRDAFVAPPA